MEYGLPYRTRDRTGSMIFNRRHFVGAVLCAAVGSSAPAALASPRKDNLAPLPAAPKRADKPPLLEEALAALERHERRVAKRDLIGVVDFTQHSSRRRFQLVDVAAGQVIASYLVAHGRGSDPAHTGWVQRLSNQPGSNASSAGSFLLANRYYGKHGASRRLIGLDPDNNLALERAIVVHGASYVDESLAATQGRIGRSLGCFAVSEPRIGEVLERLGEGHLLFASRNTA